jgi:polysaccharide export outer membrane protein
MKYSHIYLFLLVLLMASCVRHRNYRYLIPDHTAGDKDSVSIAAQHKDYILQAGDVLDIKVSSNVASSEIEVFNKRFESSNTALSATTAGNYFNGYLLDSKGFIDVPLIGKLKAEGLTCNQLNDTLSSKIAEFVSYASVTTKLGLFRFTVLGEVAVPGTREISNPYNLNIYQAIGLAGDVTDIGNKKKVKLVRKKGEQISVVKIDLSSISMVGSEYYYLQPNDVIYVEPLKAKVFRSNSSNIAILLSALTFVLVLITYAK